MEIPNNFVNKFMTANLSVRRQVMELYRVRKTDPMERDIDVSKRFIEAVKQQGLHPEAATLLGFLPEVVPAAKKYPTPIAAGFYWAKWRLPDHAHIYTPSNTWEVVEVWVNDNDPDPGEEDDNQFLVHVGGVEESQALDAFFWGPGPLPAPDGNG